MSVLSGLPVTASPSMRERFAAVVRELLRDDPRVAVVLADISAGSFDDAAYPGRVVNVGIREQLLVGAAAGLALEGLRPVVHTYAPFLVERPLEQVKLDLGHMGLGAVLVSVGASYDWAAGGRTHQAPEDVALLDALGGWTVHVPGHADEMETLLRDAARGNGRVYLRLSEQRNSWGRPVRPGLVEVLRVGSRGTVLAVGPVLDRVLAAVGGLDVTVLYAATVRPFDAATLVRTLGRPDVVVVEPYLEGTSVAAVSRALEHVPHRVLAVGVSLTELHRFGTAAEHDAAQGLDVLGIRARLMRFLEP